MPESFAVTPAIQQSIDARIATADGRRLTYGDAGRMSARLASTLTALGARRGDRVAVQVAKSPEALLLYLACVRAGMVFLPMNPAYTDAEVDYVIDDAEPSVVVCDPARRRGSGHRCGRIRRRLLSTGSMIRVTMAFIISFA